VSKRTDSGNGLAGPQESSDGADQLGRREVAIVDDEGVVEASQHFALIGAPRGRGLVGRQDEQLRPPVALDPRHELRVGGGHEVLVATPSSPDCIDKLGRQVRQSVRWLRSELSGVGRQDVVERLDDLVEANSPPHRRALHRVRARARLLEQALSKPVPEKCVPRPADGGSPDG